MIVPVFLIKHLRSNILSRADDGVSHGVVTHDFADAEVGEPDVAIAVDQDVFGLEVAVYHILTVQMHQSKYDLGTVEFDVFLAEITFLFEMEEQVAAIDVLDYEKEVRGCLEGVVQVQYERVLDLQQHLSLQYRAFNKLLLPVQGLLLNNLHGIEFLLRRCHLRNLFDCLRWRIAASISDGIDGFGASRDDRGDAGGQAGADFALVIDCFRITLDD